MAERGIEYLTSRSKRRLDILGSLAIGAALSPVAASMSLASAIDTRSTPIYQQSREGQDEYPFDVYKFRTLTEKAVADDSQTYGTHDPRASKLGLFLRKTGLDEMPQLLNVMRGDMSLVGFRPLVSYDMDSLHDMNPELFTDWHMVYTATKPGLTGPGQIYRKQFKTLDDDTWVTAMQLDLTYAERACFAEDVKIISCTPFQLLKAQLRPAASEAKPSVAA